MDKAKQVKLVELRQKNLVKKQQVEEKKHSELIGAIKGLHDLFDAKSKSDAKTTEGLISRLSEFSQFKDEVAKIKQAIDNLPKVENVAINNLSELIEAQKDFDMTEVVNAVKELSAKVENNIADSVSIKNKNAEDFIPTRRVIGVNGKLIFDDRPSGSGGGLSVVSSVQGDLVRTAADGRAIAVVNPDGTSLTAGGGLVPQGYDSISIPSYNTNNDPLIVQYYVGGLAGTLVATLTLTYAGTNISTVVRT
jgi:hypothetical protein